MSSAKSFLFDSVDYFASFATSLSFSQRSRFVILDHSVSDEEFVMKIFYHRDEYGHLIDEYVNEMIHEIKGSKELNDARWNNQVVLVEEIEYSSEYSYPAYYLIVKTY